MFRDHPFNLKDGGGGAWFNVEMFLFRFVAHFFIRHKVLSEYFVLSMSETENIFPSNFLTENAPPLKNTYPPLS